MHSGEKSQRAGGRALLLALAAMTVAAGLIGFDSRAVAGAGRLIDACSYITGWPPARSACYDMWKRWCPLIRDADAAKRCLAVLEARRQGAALPAEQAKPDTPEAGDQEESGREASASSRDAESGTTTTSVRNPDGSRTVTITDADGNVIDSHEVPATGPAEASATDAETGITTRSVRNEDGSRTVTRTNAQGEVLSSHEVPATGPAEASATDAAGTTTRSVRNEDGSHTVTVTDADGKVISTERQPPRKAEKEQPAARPEPDRVDAVAHQASMMEDFCAHVGDAAARETCYGFGGMVKRLCALIGDEKGRAECVRLTVQLPDRLGPIDG